MTYIMLKRIIKNIRRN